MNNQPKYTAPSRSGKVNISIWTDPERRTRIRIIAAQSGQLIQEIIERAIDKEVAAMTKVLERELVAERKVEKTK